MKPAKKGFMHKVKGKLQKLYLTQVKNIDPDKLVLCTLVFEGTK